MLKRQNAAADDATAFLIMFMVLRIV